MAISPVTSSTSLTSPAAATPVARTSGGTLAAQATSLSATAGVVATLGARSSSAGLYTAAGLLNSFAQAGTVTDPIEVPTAGTDTAALVQNLTDQDISAGFAADSTASGVYTGGGTLPTLAGSADWAAILKANPAAASFVIGASFASGIVDTLA